MTTAHSQDGDLATLVREHVQRDEPPFLMSAGTAMALGRRTLVRRRTRRGLATVVVAAAAALAIPLVPWAGSHRGGDRTGIDPATAAALKNYDAQRMPALIDSHVRAALGHGLRGLGAPTFTAADGQGNPITKKDYDKASDMAISYGGDGDRRVRVELMHARSEAEGDARRICANDLADGSAFVCEVSVTPSGDVVTTRVAAMRPLNAVGAHWSLVTQEELLTGVPAQGDPNESPIDPHEVYFARTVDSVHSKTFVTVAQEIVKAPSFEGAQQAFEVPTYDLEKIVTDPELVIPPPPLGADGCAWTLPDSDISCTKDPS
jgi:hypothetical protein